TGVQTYALPISDAVRHAALILGADAEVVATAGERTSFTIASLEPLVLGAPSGLRAETSVLLLRARAAVGIARGRLGLALFGVLRSARELDDVRKAATALARGAVLPSKHFRALVSRLGPRREELARAVSAARDVPSEVWWRAAAL